MSGQIHIIDRNVRELLYELRCLAVWLTIVVVAVAAILGFAIKAEGAEPYSGEIAVSSMTCFADSHFFDDWQTVSTAAWNLGASQYEHNRFEMEVRSKTGPGCAWGGSCPLDWVTVTRVPYGARTVGVSGLATEDGLRFYLVDRFTGEETEWLVGESVDAMCAIAPIPDGAAWVWTDGTFRLRLVESWEISW